MNLANLPLNIPTIERRQAEFEEAARMIDQTVSIQAEILVAHAGRDMHQKVREMLAHWERLRSDMLRQMERSGFFNMVEGLDPNPLDKPLEDR